jgi:hypothetical protein
MCVCEGFFSFFFDVFVYPFSRKGDPHSTKTNPLNLWFITNKKELVIYRNTNFQAATVWLLTLGVGLCGCEAGGQDDGLHAST